MPDHAGRARNGKPGRPAEPRTKKHRDDALEKIAQQRKRAYARAERPSCIGRARVAASERAHVLMEDVFGNQNGNAQRADEIAQREAGKISNCHLDTTFFFNSFYTIAHPAQKCNASGSYFYGACAL